MVDIEAIAGLRTTANFILAPIVTSKALSASIHVRLKLATRLNHNRVDRLISDYNLALPSSYAAFLSLNVQALEVFRPHWRVIDQPDFGGLIEAINLDLKLLGAEPLHADTTMTGPFDGLGISYVVRGSRLGSKLLRRRVNPEFPTHYLDFAPALPWQKFLEQLDEHERAGPEIESALIAGARGGFAVYEQLAREMRIEGQR